MSPKYSSEFKPDAVALVFPSGRTVTEAARELGVRPEGFRNWVKQDQIHRGQGPSDALIIQEKDKLRRMRHHNREQRQTLEVLRIAMVFFADQSVR